MKGVPALWRRGALRAAWMRVAAARPAGTWRLAAINLVLACTGAGCANVALSPQGDGLAFATGVSAGDRLAAKVIAGLAGSGGNRSYWPSGPGTAPAPPAAAAAPGALAARGTTPSRARAAAATQPPAAYLPAMSFLGQRGVVVGAAGSTSSKRTGAGFVREVDCSLTQHVLASNLGGGSPIVASVPAVQAYQRALAELPVLGSAFSTGCSDSPRGRASQPVAYLGRTAAGDWVAAAIDIQGQLFAGRASASGVVLASSKLATRTAQHFTAADLNGDGIADIVLPWQDATAGLPAGLAVYLSRGDGSFAPPTVHAVAGSRYYAFAAVGDVDGDGQPDIVMLGGSDLFTSTLNVLRGNGNGGFTAGPVRSGAGDMAAIVVADFDGDGHPDVLSAAGSFLRGNGDGSFGAPQAAWSTVGVFDHIAFADFDRDGRLDLALTTAPAGGFVTVMRGRGDGRFDELDSYAAVLGATTLGVTDVDGDGSVDIVVGLTGPGVLTSGTQAGTLTQFLLGHGDGRFVGAPAWPSPSLAGAGPSAMSALALADLDGDGVTDLVAPAPRALSSAPAPDPGQLSWRRGGPGGPGAASTIEVARGGAVAVAVADVDGDGRPDLVYATRDSLAVRRGAGGATFSGETARALPAEPLALRVGDFDGDRRADVAVLAADGLRVYPGQADASLGTPALVEATTALVTLDVADLDGDGRADLVVGRADGSVGVRLGGPGGSFLAPIALSAGSAVQALAIGDMDGDGRRDLVVAAADASGRVQLQVFPGTPGGGFGAPVATPLQDSSGSRVGSVALADFNGDGRVDVALTRDGLTGIVMGLGDGRLDTEYAFAIAGRASVLNAGDVDADGQPDLLATVDLTGVVTLLNKTRQWKLQAGGDNTGDADRVMNWAESVYRVHFPGPGSAGTYEGYRYRHYPATGNYLAAKDGRMIVHNGRDWNFLDVGAVADYLPLAVAAGF